MSVLETDKVIAGAVTNEAKEDEATEAASVAEAEEIYAQASQNYGETDQDEFDEFEDETNTPEDEELEEDI